MHGETLKFVISLSRRFRTISKGDY